MVFAKTTDIDHFAQLLTRKLHTWSQWPGRRGVAVQWELEYAYPWWSIIFARSHAVRPFCWSSSPPSSGWYRKKTCKKAIKFLFLSWPHHRYYSNSRCYCRCLPLWVVLLYGCMINFHCAKEVLHRNKNKSSSCRCQGRRAFHFFHLIRVNGIVVITSLLFKKQLNEFYTTKSV